MAGETRRLFVAVDIPESVRVQVGELAARLGRRFDARGIDGFRFVKPANLHVTLHFLGFVDAETELRVRTALEPPLATRAFDVVLDRLGTFPPRGGARVLWIAAREGADGLVALYEETAGRLHAAGLTTDARPFAAHVTLARRRMTSARHHRPLPADALSLSASGACRWRVDRVTLYESRLSSDGPSYEARLVVPLGESGSP